METQLKLNLNEEFGRHTVDNWGSESQVGSIARGATLEAIRASFHVYPSGVIRTTIETRMAYVEFIKYAPIHCPLALSTILLRLGISKATHYRWIREVAKVSSGKARWRSILSNI